MRDPGVARYDWNVDGDQSGCVDCSAAATNRRMSWMSQGARTVRELTRDVSRRDVTEDGARDVTSSTDNLCDQAWFTANPPTQAFPSMPHYTNGQAALPFQRNTPVH